MQKGTVKFFNNMRGFGFIKSSETGEDIFVHYSAIEDATGMGLQDGDRVSFVVGEGRKGPAAHEVRRLEEQGE